MSLVFRSSSRAAAVPQAGGSPLPLDGVRAADAPALFANQVEKTYPNGTVALERVRLAIQPGEFVSLLGPSGCGKSTLLKLFAGLEQPSAGHVRWWGGPALAAGIGTQGRTLAMVFQEATLMPWARVADNARLPLDLARMPRAEADERVRRALALVGLGHFGKAYPRELSGGMQMRVGICRSLVHNPDILLMDEPFSALDALTREELTLELMRIWREQPKTVLFVTHSIPESVMLADRVVVLSPRPGRIAEIINVNVPRPRQFGMEARDEFQHAAGRIRQLIFGAGRKSLH
jgi:NitT/TauT family transport system ATP-binding protein